MRRSSHPRSGLRPLLMLALLALFTLLASVASAAPPPANLGISGRVLATDGQPATSGEVLVYDESGRLVASAVVNEQGHYQTWLAPGRYKLQVLPPADSALAAQWYSGETSSATARLVSVGRTRVTADFALQPAAGLLRGSVRAAESGRALDAVSVYVYRADTHDLVGKARTESAGNYQFNGLLDGTYKLAAVPDASYAPQVYGGQSTLDAAEAIVVAAEAPATANFLLQRAGIKDSVRYSVFLPLTRS